MYKINRIFIIVMLISAVSFIGGIAQANASPKEDQEADSGYLKARQLVIRAVVDFDAKKNHNRNDKWHVDLAKYPTESLQVVEADLNRSAMIYLVIGFRPPFSLNGHPRCWLVQANPDGRFRVIGELGTANGVDYGNRQNDGYREVFVTYGSSSTKIIFHGPAISGMYK